MRAVLLPGTVVVVASAAAALLWLGRWARRVSGGGPRAMHARYQPAAALVALAALAALWGLRAWAAVPVERLRYVSVGALQRPALGLSVLANPGDTWWAVGRSFAVVATLTTALVVWSQSRPRPAPARLLGALPLAVLASLSNAAVEEVIFRLGPGQALHDVVAPDALALLSGLLFGLPHYFGSPGGVPGVVMAGFLGWLMCQSMLQTGGLAWALVLHGLQDVVIFTILFAQGGRRGDGGAAPEANLIRESQRGFVRTTRRVYDASARDG